MQQGGGPPGEIALVDGNGRIGAADGDAALLHGDGEHVADADLLEDGLQLMVAVLAASEDAQPEVDLGISRIMAQG